MKMDGKYQTSDLYVASYLLLMGLELLDVDRRDRRRCIFVFEDREGRAKLVHSFMVGRATGNLPDFIYHLKRAKRLLYSREV
ncbi:MAG: hypothetical protein KAW00_04825 [Dehalococcoidia bacterium]|nr:hypothetical protein [Dehalococcoidia bacterium]